MTIRAPRLMAATCLLAGNVMAMACPLHPPAGLQGQTVSEGLQINGLPTAVHEVRSHEPAERLIRQTELEWKALGYAPQRQRQAPWLIVSAASADCVSVLQMKGENSSEGYLSVSRPHQATEALDAGIRRLLPAHSRIDSVVRSKDQGRDGITIMLTSEQASGRWADALLHRLQDARWQNVSKHRFERPAQKLAADRITARTRKQQFTAIVWGDASTQAVITVTEPL